MTCEYREEGRFIIGYINGNTDENPYTGDKESSPIKFRGDPARRTFELLKPPGKGVYNAKTCHMTAAMAKALRTMAAKFNPNGWVSLRYYEGSKSFSVALEDFRREAIITFRRSGRVREVSWFPSR